MKRTEDEKYELTDKASEQMEWSFGPPSTKPQTVEEMLNEISSYVSYFEELSGSDRSKLARVPNNPSALTTPRILLTSGKPCEAASLP